MKSLAAGARLGHADGPALFPLPQDRRQRLQGCPMVPAGHFSLYGSGGAGEVDLNVNVNVSVNVSVKVKVRVRVGVGVKGRAKIE